MFSRFVFAILVTSAALPLYGGTIMDRSSSGDSLQGGPVDEHNLFQKLNSELRSLSGGKGDRLYDKRDGLIKDDAGVGVVSAAASALCPICREPLYKHANANFECIPKNIDGDAINVPKIERRAARCPVCQAQFMGALPGNLNSKNGLDRDMCPHGQGETTVFCNVWMCPDCGYTALIDDFGLMWDKKPITDAVRTFVREKITADTREQMRLLTGLRKESLAHLDKANLRNFAAYVQQEQIPDWFKYRNAITLYREQKAPSPLLARLYLEGAYACRRAVSGEIAVPSLHEVLEDALSKAIRRIQNDLTSACLEARKERKLDGMFDPMRTETDAAILVEGTRYLLSRAEQSGERILQSSHNGSGPPRAQFYMIGDIFVLWTRYAGFLDRVGRMDDAGRALDKALQYVPEDNSTVIPDDMPNKAKVEAFVNAQLKLMRDFIATRKKCLEFERECLYRAMWENLTAIHHKQVKFFDEANLVAPADRTELAPAITAYMLGELARRTGEPGAAEAWLAAAAAILERQTAELDREEADLTGMKEVMVASKGSTKIKLLERAAKLRERWDTLEDWTKDQRSLPLVGGDLDPNIKIVLDEVLTASGIDPAKYVPPPSPKAAKNAAKAVAKAVESTDVKASAEVKAKDPVKTAAPPAAGAKTRAQIYALYYEAIKKYVAADAEHKNPGTLKDLVSGGFLRPSDAGLDEKGALICPETRETLAYSRSFKLGDAVPILFSLKDPMNSLALLADGKIKVPLGK